MPSITLHPLHQLPKRIESGLYGMTCAQWERMGDESAPRGKWWTDGAIVVNRAYLRKPTVARYAPGPGREPAEKNNPTLGAFVKSHCNAQRYSVRGLGFIAWRSGTVTPTGCATSHKSANWLVVERHDKQPMPRNGSCDLAYHAGRYQRLCRDLLDCHGMAVCESNLLPLAFLSEGRPVAFLMPMRIPHDIALD